MQANAPDPEGRDLTPAEEAERKRRQRARSIAIALILAALVVIFYAVTMIQISSNLEGAAQ